MCIYLAAVDITRYSPFPVYTPYHGVANNIEEVRGKLGRREIRKKGIVCIDNA